MLARLPVLLLCLAASVAALSMHHVHRGLAHRALAHRAAQPTMRRRADGKRCKVRASSIASSLSSIHKTAAVHEVSTSVPVTTPKAEPTTSKVEFVPSKVESTTPKAESTTSKAQPAPPKVESTTPKAEPTTSKAEPTTSKAEPTTPKAEPTTPKAEPTTPKAEPTTPKAEPTTSKAEPTTPKAEPTTPKAEPTTTKAVTTQPPAPAPTKAPANTPSFLVGTQTGQGTFYATGLGACGIVNQDTDLIAAVSHSLFDAFPGYNHVNPNTNPMCGKKVSVSYGGNSVTVTVTDRCEACALTDLDFSPSAFKILADPSIGRLDGITWRWLD